MRAPLLLALSLTLAAAGPSPAQTMSAPSTADVDPDSALAQTLRGLEGHAIGLAEAIELALRSSPEMNRALAALRSAEGGVRHEKGAFDPELFADVEVRDSESPTASPFSGADVLDERSTSSSVGARTTLPFGTSLEASVETEKLETNNAFASLEPEYRSTGRLELRQPLLQGLGPGTKGDLSASQHALRAARLRAAQTERSVRASTEALYWELYAAERDYAVQIVIVDRASALLEQARVRGEAGLIGPNQVANARVFDAQQRLALLDQDERLHLASSALGDVIGIRPVAGGRFHASDEPSSDANLMSLDEADLVARAIESNLELAAAREDLAASESRVQAARWNALPRLDVVGSVAGAGLSGRGRDVVFGADTLRTNIDGGYGDALDQSFGFDYPEWSIGLELRLPLGLRADRGERDQRRADVIRQQAVVTELERQIASDVRDALRRLRHGQERLSLAREAVDAAREQVRVGLREFENGRTTAFELVRLGADLASTQQQLSSALVRTATARTDLERLVDGLELQEER